MCRPICLHVVFDEALWTHDRTCARSAQLLDLFLRRGRLSWCCDAFMRGCHRVLVAVTSLEDISCVLS